MKYLFPAIISRHPVYTKLGMNNVKIIYPLNLSSLLLYNNQNLIIKCFVQNDDFQHYIIDKKTSSWLIDASVIYSLEQFLKTSRMIRMKFLTQNQIFRYLLIDFDRNAMAVFLSFCNGVKTPSIRGTILNDSVTFSQLPLVEIKKNIDLSGNLLFGNRAAYFQRAALAFRHKTRRNIPYRHIYC